MGLSARGCSTTILCPTRDPASASFGPLGSQPSYAHQGEQFYGEAYIPPSLALAPEKLVKTVAEAMDIAREEMFQQAGLCGPAVYQLFALLLTTISDKALHPHIRSMDKRDSYALIDSIQLVCAVTVVRFYSAS